MREISQRDTSGPMVTSRKTSFQEHLSQLSKVFSLNTLLLPSTQVLAGIAKGKLNKYQDLLQMIHQEVQGYMWLLEVSREPLLILVQLVGLAGVITIVGGYFMYHWNERRGPIKARKPLSPKREFSDHKTTIGGPFTLANHEGDVVTVQDLIGHWTLIYFGYTSCPDDCPEELHKLAEAVELIDMQTRDKIMPVFITVDPRRDSPAQLRAYLSEFHPRLTGLTGTADSIRQVAREYRVFYKKVEDEGFDYLVEHSNLVYLMDPNMEFVKFFGREYDAKSLSSGIIEEMKKYKNVSIV